MSTASDILVRPDGDRGLFLTVCVSGCLHIAALGFLLFAQPHFLERPRIESYTVDLVSPSSVGGTNSHPGANQGAKAAQPKPATSQQQVALPAPVAEKPPPAAEPKVSAPVVPPVPKVEAKPPAPAAPPPKPVEAKPEPKPEVVAPKPEAKSEPKVEPKPQPKAETAAEAKPKPNPRPAEVPKSMQPEKASKAVARPEPAKPATEAKKEPEKAAERQAAEAARERERRIAEAIDQRAKQVRETGSSAAKSLDSRIEAAVQRRADQVGNEAEAGSGAGPISYGPGTGAGGVVKGVEYILYRTQMEARIKAAWAWAGANRSLKALVRFNILASGEIVNVRVIEPSGDPAYDTSVERALRAVSPLDPPPERYREEFSTVELEFRPEDIKS